MEDVEEGTLAVTEAGAEQHMARDGAWDVEVDLDVTRAWKVAPRLVVGLEGIVWW